MPLRIKPDVLAALADWKAGKPVKCLELGHVERMVERPPFGFVIDPSVRLYNDQRRALAYAFDIIAFFEQRGGLPDTHEEFAALCAQCEATFRTRDDHDYENLSAEEKDGAESLAWKALRFGWARAIAGHSDTRYVETQNPAAEKASA